jgi:hypothetical protein
VCDHQLLSCLQLTIFESEACILFKLGKQCNGWFDGDHLLSQVNHAIDIFKCKTNRSAQGLFIFDNAPSHQKHVLDTLSAQQMVKGVFPIDMYSCAQLTISLAPKKGWVHNAGGPQMCPGVLPTGNAQPLYFPDDHPTMPGWFKGMEVIICEHGLWPDQGLSAQCGNFKCPPGCSDCCCCWLLFMQPDFVAQKSQLQELIELCGHLCDFYPKYHCELNFIEQYWGVAKLQFWAASCTATIHDMECLIVQCLNSVQLPQI